MITKAALPKQVCVLDIETAKVDFKNPEKCEIAIVGVKVWKLQAGKYVEKIYQHYTATQLRDLEKFLKAFPGIIVGHHIFQFDYRVLRKRISLEGVIERSVDTLAFLHKKDGNAFGNISLDKLTKLNFGIGKTITGKQIPKLWREGEHSKVIEYNENDCELTMKLWHELVCNRSIKVGNKVVKASVADVALLTAVKPRFTYDEWKQKIEQDGFILSIRESQFYPDWEPPIEGVFHALYCRNCKRTFIFVAKVHRGHADHEIISCPKCIQELGELRIDLGYESLGSVAGNLGKWQWQDTPPVPFEKFMQSPSVRNLLGRILNSGWPLPQF